MAFHFKPEVGMSAGLAAAVLVQVATEVFDRYHAECWLTSANDGTHRADSFHYKPEVGMSAGLAAAVLVQVATEVFDRYHAECWLTSANDGTHRADSFHYRDLAWDLRTQHLKPL